jgi:hypothetical protein
MPLFSKAVADITTADLEELLEAGAAESIRLEFKRDPPGPEDTLKKLSSFANTFGGYMIVGAGARSSDGRLETLPGVEPQPNYRQTIVQRCNEGIWPPIEVVVSDEIPAPSSPDRVCYVVYVPESLAAPHFLNRGKGAWIRTDEFSHRFDARLANYEQLTHLGSRRALAVQRREMLFERSLRRFDTLVTNEYSNSPATSGELGANVALILCPLFPTTKLRSEYELLEALPQCIVKWRQVGFPRSRDAVTQLDSVIVLQPAHGFSIAEASVWGHLFYACEIEHLTGDNPATQVAGIHLYAFVGHILVFLEHARRVYRKLGYDGPIQLRTNLRGIRGKRFMHFPNDHTTELGPSSRLDDAIDIELTVMGTRLEAERDAVVGDLFRLLFFAMNWAERANEPSLIRDLLNKAAYYNFWR